MERKLLLPWNYTNAFSHLPSSLTQWLFWDQVKNKKKKKKKKTQRPRAGEKEERKHFLNEGEKERKEGGDKEIRTNVYFLYKYINITNHMAHSMLVMLK